MQIARQWRCRQSPTFAVGQLSTIFRITRLNGSIHSVANWSSQPAVLPSGPDTLPPLDGAELLLGTHDDPGEHLAPWESRIYRLA